MKTYEVQTLASTELIEAESVDDADLHSIRFILPGGKKRSFGRGSLISYQEVTPRVITPPAQEPVTERREA